MQSERAVVKREWSGPCEESATGVMCEQLAAEASSKRAWYCQPLGTRHKEPRGSGDFAVDVGKKSAVLKKGPGSGSRWGA